MAPVVPDAPAALEVMERAGVGKRVLVLINHGDTPLRPSLPGGAKPVSGDLREGVPLAVLHLVPQERLAVASPHLH